MTNDTERANELIRSLVEGLIEHPHDLELSSKTHPGITYWTMKAHAEDQSKVIGKGGAHVKALDFLIKAVGKAHEELHTLKVLEPEKVPRREAEKPRAAESYDPRPARDLLCLLLENLALGDFVVECEKRPPEDVPLCFTFWIEVRSVDDYEALTVADPKGAPGMTIIGAAGTLFRARARRDGVKFYIEVRHP